MSKSFSSALSVVGGILLCFLFIQNTVFGQAVNSEWTDVPLSGTDAFSIDAEYRYKVSSQGDFWFYPKEVSARSLVSNESYYGQIFYVSADAKSSYQYNGNFLDTVVQIQKRTLLPWTDVSLTGTDPFDLTNEYRFKMTVPGRPGVPAGDFWYYAKQVGAQSLVMDNGYGEITFVSAANKTAYLSQGTPTGITISQMQRRALIWNDVPLNTTEVYDVSCDYRFKMNYPSSPQWRPGVPAGDFWHYPERSSAQSLIANANGGYQTFSVFANNKAAFDFNGVYNNAVLQMQKRCFVPPPTLCSEGQYFCSSENICKPAGQSCGAAICYNNTPVSWTQFSNPSPTNINSPSAASLGSASGSIQLGTKNIQVSYAGDVRSVGIADNWSWVWTNNTAPFLSTLVSNIPDHAHLLGVFGGSQAMNTLTFSEPVTNPILLFYSIGGGGASVTYEFDRPFTIVSGSTGMAGMGDFVNPSGNILRGAEGYGVIQFQGTFSNLSFKVPTAEYWSAFTVGLKEAVACSASATCNNNNTCEAGESCNCADCTNGGDDDADKCGLSSGLQMVCTKDKDNTTTVGAFSSVTAQENFNTVNNKLATVLSQSGDANIADGEFDTAATELKLTQYDWKDTAGNFIYFSSFTSGEAWTKVKELLFIPAGAQVLWSTSSIKYENDSLGNNERYLYSYVIQQTSGVQKQIFFATEYLPVTSGWRKIYFISKDYPLSPTATGTEVCQNFTNPTLFGKPLALGSPSVGSSGIAPFCLEHGFRGTSTVVNTSYITGWLTLWKADNTGWKPNENGDKIDEIRCCGIPSNATSNTVPVGACCPAGKEWSSSAGQCVTEAVDKCLEGQYYCHAELKCKPANETCDTVTCNNNNTCDTNESCDCADCNEKADHCGVSTNDGQLICTTDGTPRCYTDKFPYCLSGCLDGYKMDASGQCVNNLTVPDSSSRAISFNKYYKASHTGGAPDVETENIGAHDFCFLNRFGEPYISDSTAGYCEVKKNTAGTWDVTVQAKNNEVECNVMCVTDTPTTPPPANLITFNKYYKASHTGGAPDVETESIGQHDFCFLNRYGHPYVSDSTAGYCEVKKETSGIWTVTAQAKNNEVECNVMCVTDTPTTPPLANLITFNKYYKASHTGGAPDVETENIGAHDFCYLNRFGEPYISDSTAGYCEVKKNTAGTWDVTVQAKNNEVECNVSCVTVASGATIVSGDISQQGACCPPGSAWNSLENRCVPTTCGEGQFYCAAQKKCLAGGTTCDITVCNNDGVCSGEESCQCTDCVNGGGDDKDKCSIIGGVQAMCSDDNLGDGKPGACCIPPKKWNSTTNSCVECSNTQAPSELKAGVDEPYITCTGNGDTTKTHFRYRITKQGVTETPFISDMYTVGTQVLHPTMTLGDYIVECFYGNATGVDTSTTAALHSCVKTMSVKSDAQGCSRVYPYKGSTLSDEMTSTFAFDASFRCGSRKPVAGTITNPYMFRVGAQPISYLSFDSLISELFNGLTIGPVSNQTQSYNFDTGTTDVTCATKVGGGYSTNTACRVRACAGGDCNVPQTFSVIHSDDLTCTTEDTSTYNIGCNPAAPDSVRNACINWFRETVKKGSEEVPSGVKFNVTFIFNNTTTPNIECIKYNAGQMPGGLNLSDNVVCSAKLNNGERYQIYAADTNGRIDALQTTAKTVERDRENPTMAEIKYYTDDTLTTEVPTTNWYNKPIIALAVCSDTPLNEATSCACAKTVDPTTTDAAFWSAGVPNSLIGADLMRYTRTITESTVGTQKVLVMDTAGNKSGEKNVAVSLDTQAPIVVPVESGTGTTKTITLTATDAGSKIWKTTTAPSGSPAATNTNGIIYRVGLKADMQTLAFDAECNTTSSFATVAETKVAGFPSQALATVSLNTATHVVAYCVRDNAGNTTRGIYPVTTNACFSSSNMATIPKLDTYKDLLKTRLSGAGNDNQKYGYSFSENTTDANCFRGILANNVTTLMANQLKAKTSTTLSNWDTDRSQLSTSTTLSNGYYYYVYPTSNTLDIVTPPTSSGAPVKTVVVDGGDIRIKTDLIYSGEGKTLLIIARKNTNGQGGNIIIDTNVKRIDAILIADGGALKSSDATLPGERLIINGRLYSYNTRGGSLSVSGADLIDATVPKRFTNASLVNASSLNDARIQDLERFRPMFADGTNTCSLTVNYTAFTATNLPALLKRPSTFAGGSCGF